MSLLSGGFRTGFALLLGGLALAEVPCAWGQSEPTPIIGLDMPGCSDAEQAEVRRLVGVEMQANILDAQTAGAISVVRVTCAEARYEIVVETQAGAPRRRVLDLRATGASARPRFVALAIVEVMTTAPENEQEPEPAELPEPLAARATAAEPVSRWQIGARGLARFFPEANRNVWGLGVRVGRWLTPGLMLVGDAVAEAGSQSVSLGRVSTRAGSLGARLVLIQPVSIAAFGVGAGARLGLVDIAGEASGAAVSDSFLAAWGGPTFNASIAARLSRTFMAEAGAELGVAMVRATGLSQGREPVGIDGAWIAIHVGVGWYP